MATKSHMCQLSSKGSPVCLYFIEKQITKVPFPHLLPTNRASVYPSTGIYHCPNLLNITIMQKKQDIIRSFQDLCHICLRINKRTKCTSIQEKKKTFSAINVTVISYEILPCMWRKSEETYRVLCYQLYGQLSAAWKKSKSIYSGQQNDIGCHIYFICIVNLKCNWKVQRICSLIGKNKYGHLSKILRIGRQKKLYSLGKKHLW